MNFNENDLNEIIEDAGGLIWRIAKIIAIIVVGFYLMYKFDLSAWWLFVIVAIGTMV